ncbi:MAG: PKD domain-containing protein [Saprospiraceae bacterium]|nr:PKD domain-containing protein [Saprospiraceae bacterium]
MKNLQSMARTCGATALLMLFGFLPVSFRTKAPIPTPLTIESTKTCPTANFSFSGAVSGAPTYFSNLSTQFNTCSWDFGDGSSSTATNPQHTYATPGTYQVRLTVFGDACTTSFIGTVDVIAD